MRCNKIVTCFNLRRIEILYMKQENVILKTYAKNAKKKLRFRDINCDDTS